MDAQNYLTLELTNLIIFYLEQAYLNDPCLSEKLDHTINASTETGVSESEYLSVSGVFHETRYCITSYVCESVFISTTI